MKPTQTVAHRLALLERVNLSQADLDAVVTEIQDLDRIIAELEEFAQATPWVSQQVQPMGNKV
jgi:hypothetical protein